MSLSDHLLIYLVWSIDTGSLNFEHYDRSAIFEVGDFSCFYD